MSASHETKNVEERSLPDNFGYRKTKLLPISDNSANPLKLAMDLVGARPNRDSVPHSSEAGYNLICTLPIVDAIQKAPLQMPAWADLNASLLQESAQKGLHPLLDQLMKTLDPDHADHQVDIHSENQNSLALIDVLTQSYRRQGREFSQNQSELITAVGFSPEFDHLLAVLLQSLISASQGVDDALGSLTMDEKRLLRASPERYFFPNGDYFHFLTADSHSQVKMVQIAEKIDFLGLFESALRLSYAVDRFIAATEHLKHSGSFERLFNGDKVPDGEIVNIATPIGNLVLLGEGPNQFSGDAMLLIDLGGNDHYTSSSTMKSQMGGNVNVSIDFGGDDSYDARENKLSQGAGSLSIGLMVDRSGNDEYQAGDLAQGAAFFGVGLLVDNEGNDLYQMGLMGQGFGLFGFGALADGKGNDRYVLKGMGQGAGSTLGIGALLDKQGDDKYLAGGGKTRSDLIPDSMTHCQGAGLSIRSHTWTDHLSIYGGIGILSDKSGNDLYHATGGNCMGSSYFMSLGALVDREGNDIYMPEGGYGAGFGLHLSNGVLLDMKGDDVYVAGSYCGGFGSDRSVGILIDVAGNDVYGPSKQYLIDLLAHKAKGSDHTTPIHETSDRIQQKMADTSYGTALKPKATGLLVDLQGDDQYFANPKGKGESIGGVVPPVDPEDWSHGIVIDLAGNDRYNLPDKQNNHASIYYEHGVCYDMDRYDQASAESLFPKFRFKGIENLNAKTPNVPGNSPMAFIHKMTKADLWGRFSLEGRLLQMGPAAIEACIDVLRASKDAILNSHLLEILNRNMLASKTSPTRQPISGLFSASSRQVKLRAVYLTGWQRLKTAEGPLMSVCDESDDTALRAAAFWALGRLLQPTSLNTLMKGTDKQNSLATRRAAYGSLAALADNDHSGLTPYANQLQTTFITGLNDPDPVIKVRSIRGLGEYFGQHSIAKRIRQLLADPNVYVRREAARVSAFNGDPKGIPVLIKSLRFPSIDTHKHYDHEIAKDLAYLCGVDFPDDKRYRYETWQRWWMENGSEVNLSQNLRIMEQIKKAFLQPELERGLQTFKNLTTDYPENRVIRKRYIHFCHEWITFRLLNQKHVSISAMKNAIRLQKILIALEPGDRILHGQLNYLQTRLDTMQNRELHHHKIAPD